VPASGIVPRSACVAVGVSLAVGAVGTALAGSIPPGALDPFFGNEGISETSFGGINSDDRAHDLVALAPHGKLIVVGEALLDDSGTEDDFALAGYEPEGHRDTDFGNGGLRTTDFRGGDDQALAAALAPDNKIVVAGTADAAPPSPREFFAVARYKLNGKLDKSFSQDGLVTTKMKNSEQDEGHDVVVAGNGKITVAGESEPNSGGVRFALARYKPDGSLDESFSGDGRVTTAFPGTDGSDEAAAIARAGGKVVVAGQSDQGSNEFALARYTKDGSLDPGFGDGGRVTSDLSSANSRARDVLVQPNGRIVAAGDNALFGAQNYAIARYLTNGELDDSFSGDGFDVFGFSASPGEVINGLAIQSNGKILAAGGSGGGDFAVLRFLSTGGLDPDFSSEAPAGVEFTDLYGTNDEAEAIVLQPSQPASKRSSRRGTPAASQKAVAAGSSDQTTFQQGFDFMLARYYSHG
jgi:uncharacterized delta-60 repeat protein